MRCSSRSTTCLLSLNIASHGACYAALWQSVSKLGRAGLKSVSLTCKGLGLRHCVDATRAASAWTRKGTDCCPLFQHCSFHEPTTRSKSGRGRRAQHSKPATATAPGEGASGPSATQKRTDASADTPEDNESHSSHRPFSTACKQVFRNSGRLDPVSAISLIQVPEASSAAERASTLYALVSMCCSTATIFRPAVFRLSAACRVECCLMASTLIKVQSRFAMLSASSGSRASC